MDQPVQQQLPPGEQVFPGSPGTSSTSDMSPLLLDPAFQFNSDGMDASAEDFMNSDGSNALNSSPLNFIFGDASGTPGSTGNSLDQLLGINLASSPSAFSKDSKLPPLPVIQMDATEDNGSATKKRKKGQSGNEDGKGAEASILSEVELLKFDSNQMESYIKSVSSAKHVTPSQLKELKRVRRLIKNREYAQSSRNKKKQYVEEIEKKLQDSNAENSQLQQKLIQLEMENKALKLQLTKIGTAIKQDPEILQRMQRIAGKKAPSTPSTSTGSNKKFTATVSASLFVILFSFGLFMNFGGREPIPRYNTGRTLKSLEFDSLSTSYVPYLMDKYAPSFIQNVYFGYMYPAADSDELDPFACDSTKDTLQGNAPIESPQLDVASVNAESTNVEQEPQVLNQTQVVSAEPQVKTEL